MQADGTITHRERVIFPASGETKGDLADYYAAIAPLMLRFVADRPVSLVRCPQGQGGPCFFQKHHGGGFGPAVHTVPIVEKDGERADYLWLDSAEGLAACVQMGTIEFHEWAAPAHDVERPDRMVFDLDPGPGLGFADVARAAREIRDRLATRGLASFALLTGGKGVHVVVPLAPGASWQAHAGFARAFAKALAEAEPARFVATMSKAKRTGRIFVDYLRNQRGATAIAPYSVRARAGAPVAAPVAWDELDGLAGAQTFAIRDARKLLDRANGEALGDWGMAEQRLPEG